MIDSSYWFVCTGCFGVVTTSGGPACSVERTIESIRTLGGCDCGADAGYIQVTRDPVVAALATHIHIQRNFSQRSTT